MNAGSGLDKFQSTCKLLLDHVLDLSRLLLRCRPVMMVAAVGRLQCTEEQAALLSRRCRLCVASILLWGNGGSVEPSEPGAASISATILVDHEVQ